MLVTFSFKNFGPFRDEACLDLRAVPAYKEHGYNLAQSSMGENLLKVVALYGANAAGKSQLIEAYRCFSGIVANSFSQSIRLGSEASSVARQSGRFIALRLYYKPFRFSSESTSAPTEFEATYDVEGGELRYGFMYDREKVISEWLYFVKDSTKRQTVVLERDGSEIEFGASVRGECEKYASNISQDTLVLSFLDSMNLKTPYFRLASSCVGGVMTLPSLSSGSVSEMLVNISDNLMSDQFHKGLIRFLRGIDTCIEDVTVRKSGDRTAVYTHHKDAEGNDYEVPIYIESEGTRKAIALYYFLSIALDASGAVMVDELSSALHPLLTRALVTQFYREGTRGQIIFTTHDTSLLDRRYLRRDQVWFVDKGESGESELYSLSDFKLRSDANFTKGYLSGMFGAIPNLREFVLGEDANEE